MTCLFSDKFTLRFIIHGERFLCILRDKESYFFYINSVLNKSKNLYRTWFIYLRKNRVNLLVHSLCSKDKISIICLCRTYKVSKIIEVPGK